MKLSIEIDGVGFDAEFPDALTTSQALQAIAIRAVTLGAAQAVADPAAVAAGGQVLRQSWKPTNPGMPPGRPPKGRTPIQS